MKNNNNNIVEKSVSCWFWMVFPFCFTLKNDKVNFRIIHTTLVSVFMKQCACMCSKFEIYLSVADALNSERRGENFWENWFGIKTCGNYAHRQKCIWRESCIDNRFIIISLIGQFRFENIFTFYFVHVNWSVDVHCAY